MVFVIILILFLHIEVRSQFSLRQLFPSTDSGAPLSSPCPYFLLYSFCQIGILTTGGTYKRQTFTNIQYLRTSSYHLEYRSSIQKQHLENPGCEEKFAFYP